VAYEVDARKHAMETAGPDPAAHGLAARADRPKLPVLHEAALSSGEPRDFPVENTTHVVLAWGCVVLGSLSEPQTTHVCSVWGCVVI
jgi:hypothetical protein